jgi:hypothetical protein
MSAFSDEISGACEEMEGDLGNTLTTAQNLELPCIPSMEEVGNTVVIGPLEEVIQVALLVRKSYFITADNTIITVDSDEILADNSSPRPRSGSLITFRGKRYRSIMYEEDPSGAFFKIYLTSPR